MANPNIKFFRCNPWPSTVTPQEGYVWFNTTDRTINLYKNGAWEAYSGIKSASYANNRLIITPCNGSAIDIDLSILTKADDLVGLIQRVATLESNYNTLSGSFETEKGKISTLQGEMTTVQTEVAKLSDITGKVGAYVVEQFRLHDEARAEIDGGFESRISTLETGQTTLDGKIDGVQSTLQGAINTEKGRIDALVGSDSGSIRDIAIDVLTETLVKEGADEAYDTLTEVSEWIKNHPESAATMNEAINTNASNISTLTGKVEELEKFDHDAYKGADDALRTELQGYADQAEADALSAAKSYTDELKNGQVNTNTTNIATNTADIATIKGNIETINTTIEENELVIAEALNDLNTRVDSLASGTVTSVTGEGYITATTTDGAVTVGATTGSVANGVNALAVASDVKSYVDSCWTWGEF